MPYVSGDVWRTDETHLHARAGLYPGNSPLGIHWISSHVTVHAGDLGLGTPLGGYVAVPPPPAQPPAPFVKKEIAWHMRRRNRLKFLSANRRRFKPYSLPPELTSPSLDGL